MAAKNIDEKPTDPFFNKGHHEQKAYVAQLIGCDKDAPVGWPHDLLDTLIEVRKNEGKGRFYAAVGKVLSPEY